MTFNHLGSTAPHIGQENSPNDEVAALLAGVDAAGRSRDGTIAVTLDGTGRLGGVEVSSAALAAGRGGIERAIREAFDDAWSALTEARAEKSDDVRAAATRQIGDLTGELRLMQDAAGRQLQEALAAMRETAARIAPTAPVTTEEEAS